MIERDGKPRMRPHLLRADGGRDELDRVALPRSVPSGESVEVIVELDPAAVGTAGELTVDLVAEGVCWFGERGSSPATVELPG